MTEIEDVISSLPLRKAAGYDHLTNEHLRFAAPPVNDILTITFNSILLSGHIPTSFRHGLIVPIPKGRNIDVSNPSNFRGITLLPVISKLFEKLLLSRLSSLMSNIHPLQGCFRPKTSCIHTAFVLQESIQHLRSHKKKAYVAFLDVKKAYDTVWHEGLLLKLLQFNFPRYIWSLLHNWYTGCTSSVLWNSHFSRSFPIRQGVRQGAVLSPFLYTIFVNNLLVQLSSSGHGVKIGDIFCGAPMYADDLALISDSETGLQHMLDIVSLYAAKWNYELNARKSATVVIGESQNSRDLLRQSRRWYVSGEIVPEKDIYHHLGILRSVSASTLQRTTERCSAGRSAFFSLNAIGARFGCLHPATTLRLYKTFCIPILLYGSELWHITKTELLLLERVHRRILRTLLGLPVHCSTKALLHILGILDVKALIHQRQMNFLFSFSRLPSDSLPLQLLRTRLENPPPTGLIPTLQNTLAQYGFPPTNIILAGHWSQGGWKRTVRRLLLAEQYADFTSDCSHLPLSECAELKLGRIIPHLLVCRGFPRATKLNITRIRLLVNCHGLGTDTCRFRNNVSDPTCKLCGSGPEDTTHFISHCPALSSSARILPPLLAASDLAPLLDSDPNGFAEHILGIRWIEDPPLQREIVVFLHRLHSEHHRQLLALI